MSAGRQGRTSILIAEDDRCFRSFLTALLEEEGFAVVSYETGKETLAAALLSRPRLAILDVNLPDLSGYQVCRALRKDHGDQLPILFISGERTESFDRVAGLLIGGDDYLVKPFAADELLARVHALLRRSVNQPQIQSRLTHRELEILRLLADGLKPCVIAERLVISPRTVGSHIEHIFHKLGVHTRAEAVVLAFRLELVES